MVVVGPDRGLSTGIIRQLVDRLAGLPGCAVDTSANIRVLPPLSALPENVLGLVVIPPSIDLATSDRWRGYLAGLEASGSRFKLAMESSLGNRFALENICHDLFLIDDGWPWVGEYDLLADCIAVDAGHDVSNEVSLWVAAAYRLKKNGISMRFNAGRLHEDLPDAVLADVERLSAGEKRTFFRDGRFHKGEIAALNDRGIDRDDIYFVTKNPGAILFRGSMDAPELPKFGDCLRYPDGSVLLQSLEPGAADYERPISLRGCKCW